MDVTFLTPVAGLFALTVLLPLGIWARRSRRAQAIRASIGLEAPTRRQVVPVVAAVAAVPLLLGVASAQPVIGTTRDVPERVDAQVFFLLDTSRSMLASETAGSATRFDRARDIAESLRGRIPQVPAGLLSMTDRILPHAFPTTDERVFTATLRNALDVERPPPTFTYSTSATSYDLLAGIPERAFYPKTTTKRLLVVLTDGESRPFGGDLTRAFQRKPRVETVFVRIWSESERIYETGVAEGGYTPDPASADAIERVAGLVGGQAFDESEADAAGDALVKLSGQGETRGRAIAGARLALMPYVTLLALLPLLFVLWRRNVAFTRG